VKTKTRVRAGTIGFDHNETLVNDKAMPKGLKVKTKVRAGGVRLSNHNETLLADRWP
jgi:hypothetical protein